MTVAEKHLNFSLTRSKREIFNSLFPRGMDVTVANTKRIPTAGLSIRWIASQVLDAKALERFHAKAKRMLNAYLQATKETRERFRDAKATKVDHFSWRKIHAAHKKNKLEYWKLYLDGLAEAFVEAISIREAVSFPPAANTP